MTPTLKLAAELMALAEKADIPEIDVQRFYQKFMPEPMSGCWLWLAAQSNGYGILYRKDKKIKAHRFSYRLHKGKIPRGLVVDHKCNNTFCVNPDHLQCLTIRENTLRGTSQTVVNYLKNICNRGHNLTPENTGMSRGTQRRCKQCDHIYQLERGCRRRAALAAGEKT